MSARIELAPSSKKSGVVTMLLLLQSIHITWYHFSRRARRTAHTHDNTAEERGGDDR